MTNCRTDCVKYELFDHPNLTNFKCPICGTNDDKPVFLACIANTAQDGKPGEFATFEARQYHVDCIQLWEVTNGKMNVLVSQEVEPPKEGE